ncbi:MAG: DUF6445 family protein [Paraglaciecola sp.]|uniref:DUF6445 family protein n=1 Tax=Paraglaciecola sp. TaxID=1920173 RepID=UPI0032977240
MQLSLAPDIKITKSRFGHEQAPLIIIDNFIKQPEQLVEHASQQHFLANSPYYPGVRASAPIPYQQLLLQQLQSTLIDYFELETYALSLSVCHYSIVSTAPQRLKLLQRIPHFDSLDKNGLAAVHYLFKKDLGGTSFYRHRKTGFEYINQRRELEYYRSLESENDGENMPSAGYINGDTALFERISEVKGLFNRIIIYRRNSLHSGSISKSLPLDPTPLNGRLSISTFLDPK